MKRGPRHLKKATRKWWMAVINNYELEEHHLKLLTLAGEAWDRCQDARKMLDREGVTYLNKFNEPRARPEVAIERDSRLAFARILREINLDISVPENRPPRIAGKE